MDARPSSGMLAVFRNVQRPCLRHPLVADDATRKLRQPGVEVGNVALGPRGDLSKRSDSEIVQHALEHGPDPDDQLQVVGLGFAKQYRRRSLVLDVDHELTITCGLGARVAQLAYQRPGVA